MVLDPQFPADPYVYVLLHARRHARRATRRAGAPRASTGDGCPNPPGATGDGCVVTGRLARLTATGDTATAETPLITDWCQQYPSHSIGDLGFGADGALYVSGGDGASFNFVDYGQDGSPVNPCGDPPGPPGFDLTPPTAEGGALRSQDVRTTARTTRRRSTGRCCASTPTPEPPFRATRSSAAATPTATASSPTGSATPSSSRCGPGPTRPGPARPAGAPGRSSTACPTRAAPPRTSAGPATRAGTRVGAAERLRRREPQPLRDPLCARRAQRRQALLLLQPLSPGRRRRELPDRQLLGREASTSTRPAASPTPTTAPSSSPTTPATASGRCPTGRNGLPDPVAGPDLQPGRGEPDGPRGQPDGELFYTELRRRPGAPDRLHGR